MSRGVCAALIAGNGRGLETGSGCSRGLISVVVAALGSRLVAASLGIATLRSGSCGGVAVLRAFAVAAAEELDVVCDYFCHELLEPLLVCVGTGADMTLYINLAAFADIALCKVSELAPQNEVVPLGVFSEFAGAVAVAVCGGKGECGDLCALAGLGCALIKVTYFRVSTNVTDKEYFVQ